MEPVPILLYHGVADDAPGPLAPFTVTPAVFASHLDRLVARGARTLTVSDLVDHCLDGGHPVPEGTVLVTFDDGFADFASAALPALEERGLSATLYITTGGIGGTCSWLGDECRSVPMLTGDALRGLDPEVVEVGAHSVTHPQLDVLPPDQAAREITGSKAALEEVLGRPVRSFAYPHGYHDATVRRAVIEAGYHSACAVKNAVSHTGDDRFALARVTVTADTTLEDLDRVLDGVAPRPVRDGERLRTTAWRVARRLRHRTGSVRS